jgi:Protein of unknown function (DUF3501)
MKPITIDEILPLDDYERVRPRLRPLFMHEKDRRRIGVGAHLTFLFENPQTAWYQIEEMIRTEKLVAPAAIQHEIDTYNELVPAGGELVATLLIEYRDARERDPALRRLVGIENHLWLVLDTRRVPAEFDTRQMSTEQVSAVQFVRFKLGATAPADLVALAREGKLALEADHPSLAARAAIAPEFAAALAEDLE